MTEAIIQNKPITKQVLWLITLSVAYPLGFIITSVSYGTTDWLLFSIDFIVLPVVLIICSYIIGWHMKKHAIAYHRPNWSFETRQYTLDEAIEKIKNATNGNSRIIAAPHFWLFFIPIVSSLSLLAFALYSIVVEPVPFINLLTAQLAGYFILHSFSFWSGWRSTSNAASSDFTTLLLPENIRLAKTQSKIPGVADLRLVIETAEEGEYSIFQSPRVIFRLEGLESETYVESMTDEIGSIIRLRSGIIQSDRKPEVEFYWTSRDRFFRKEDRISGDSYYVEYPVPTAATELGVKDVALVTKNAIALVLLDYGKRHQLSEKSKNILSELGVMTNSS